MRVLLLLAAVIAATKADISEILRGQNDVAGRYYQDTTGQYRGDESGRYVHQDNPYSDDSGKYYGDDSGRYVHQDNPYLHDVQGHPPYEHVDVPPVPYVHVDVPYVHVDVPHTPYEHVDVPHPPYEHVDVPHPPYEHITVPPPPYRHDVRTYLPPPPPKPVPDTYRYVKPEKSFNLPIEPPPRPAIPRPTAPRPFVAIQPKPIQLRAQPPARPAPAARPFTVAPGPAHKGTGPYKWNLDKTGDHKVEHPEYKLKVGLIPS